MLALKTLPQIDQALRKRAAFHARRGRKYTPRMPRLLPPKALERQYTLALSKSFTKLFDLVSERLGQALPTLVDRSARDLAVPTFDAADDELRLLLGSILVEFGRELPQTQLKSLANRLGLSVNEFNKRQNGKVFKQVLAIDVTTHEDWLSTAIEAFSAENAALITTLSQRHIDQVRALVIEGFRNGTTAKDLSNQIENKINAKTKANYRLIARDQVNKLNGQLTQLRQRSVGVTRYVWRTSLDERVRPSHRSKEGNTYQWDNPPDDTGHPGMDFQCRCYSEPILEDLINE